MLRFAVIFIGLMFANANLLPIAFSQSLNLENPTVWRQFRGPGGMGSTESMNVTTVLDTDSNLRWRTPTPGIGWSSPVYDGKRLWMTAAIVTEATAEQRASRLANVQMPNMKEVAGTADLLVICLDAETGQVVHERTLENVESPNPIHPMNSYASPTCAISDDRVVCHFGGYGTWCLDTETGKTIWSRQLVVDDSVGPGSSPVIVDGKVLIVCDGIDQQFIAALSIVDGSQVWKTARPPIRATNGEFQKAYCTPLLIDVDGQRQAVIPGAQWCAAYDPNDGRELWRIDHGDGFSVTPMALYTSGLIIFSTGYTSPELVAIDPRGIGDATQTNIRWRSRRNAPTKPSLVTDNERIYAISDDGILSALAISTGETLWRERIGGQFSASPLISGDNIYIANHEGELTVFKASEAFQRVNKVNFDEQIMASPVVIGNDLVIRTKEAVYRFAGN